MTRLRVLCLHGYAQNASIMKKQLSEWQAALVDKVEFVFASGPLQAIVSDEIKEKQVQLETKHGFEPLKAWVVIADKTVVGFSESLRQAQDFITKEGPFDGIMGFSQGALVAGSLIHLSHINSTSNSIPKFQFAILVSGFIFKGTIVEKLFRSPVNIPSLHIISEHDDEVPAEFSHELTDYFKHPEIIIHDRGHEIPNHPEIINQIHDFFDNLPVKMSKNANKVKL